MSGRENRSPDDDYELVARCKKGDLDAFESLVIKHQGKMLNIAFRMVGNYEDACEIVQDAFLSAYRGIGNFEKRSRFSTWLYTIVINTSRNRLRQIRSAVRHEQFSLDDTVATGSGSMRVGLASDCPSAAEQLEKKELQAKVQGCINRLESEFREVLVLRDIQGFSYEEISDMLKIAQGTVKSRLFRARENMKDCLRKVLGR
ncbi:MAG: sigma-70 family RNA polymerase sigma factor [Nitrospirota bacterium]|nr:sigma-70 family RNA polymerase sigma factor [Nitrospirota bacterium]